MKRSEPKGSSIRSIGIPVKFELFLGVPVLAFLILLPALWNGYPLIYSDTGTYIASGYSLYLPVDRPLGYGLFLRYTSLGWLSMWIPIAAQAILVAIMIVRSWAAITSSLSWPVLICLTLLLSIGTAAGWHGGRLQPDIFTSLAILAICLQYFTVTGKWATALDHGIIILACITHLSNVPVTIALLVALVPHAVFVRRRERFRSIKKILAGTATVGASILLLIGINFTFSGEAMVGGSSHVFLTGRLLDSGLLRPWLEKDCLTHHYFLCDRMDEIPASSQELLWYGNSPMNDSGGWLAVREETNAMLGRFFKVPGNTLAFIGAGIVDTGKQLLLWGLDHEMISQWYRDPNSPPSMAIRHAVPHESEAYFNSLQNGGRGELRMEKINFIHYSLLWLATIGALIFILLSIRKAVPAAHAHLLVYLLIGIILAAGSGAALSIPDQRFFAKVSWLLPFVVSLVWYSYYLSKKPMIGMRPRGSGSSFTGRS